MDEATELIKRHLEGDPEAAQRLVQQHQDLVYRLACQMLGPGEEARDAAQEAFLHALQYLSRFRGECAFSTWLYRIALNTCAARSSQRRKRRDREVLLAGEDLPGPDGSSPLEVLERQERDQELHQAIAALPADYRSVVVLRYLQELSYEDVAQALGLPLGTVKIRLFRAKKLLQRRLRHL